MSKLYCEPEEDMSVGSFIDPESNVKLQLKKGKSQKKITTIKKLIQRFQFFA